ncbi:MAG: T9SS type A sorting domain-containing protein [Saprospiraceae bacterium]|nr:T9SS type A sorting domain-containing protein [Saprospiraceae bacterium]
MFYILPAQELIFATGFNDALQSSTGQDPSDASNVIFVEGIDQSGIHMGEEAILKYETDNAIFSESGGMTLWVRPNWKPGEMLRRIFVVESSPVFEMHVEETGSLIFAMFSDQIETRILGWDVNSWQPGDWHFIGFTWSSDGMVIFVDGQRVAQTPVGFEIPSFGSGMINLGSLNGMDPFDGTLDELKIYDGPISDDQIRLEYEAVYPPPPPPAPFKGLQIVDIFGRDVTHEGISLVDWEGPVRNPAMKYSLLTTDSIAFPLSVQLSTTEENTSFNLPSTISQKGAAKTIVLQSKDSIESFLFSYYMDKDYENDSFDLKLTYEINGTVETQVVPVKVIDQDYSRPLTYPVIVDYSEAVHPVMTSPEAQAVITEAAEDWLYYIDGTGIDEIPIGGSTLDIGGTDHFFEEKRVSNPVPYTGYYLYAFGNSNPGPCVCSTGSPNREQLQTSNGIEVPVFRIGALHLNIFGQAYMTEPTGWEVLSPYENWTQEGLVGTDMYTLAKHEIGHAMVFENSPLFLLAQGRDPSNPHPDVTQMPPPNGFTSPALSSYYPDTIVPLFKNSLSHVIDVLDPASKVPPYGGGVPIEIMPNGREMLTKLDILIMESVGYPLRENEVTKMLSVGAEDVFVGDLGMPFDAAVQGTGGVPVYDYVLIEGSLPPGISLDRRTGRFSGTPAEVGDFPLTIQVKDYDERSHGANVETTIRIRDMLSSADELISFAFDSSLVVIRSRIDTADLAIYFELQEGTDVTSLIPLIEISEGATIIPAIGEAQDFSSSISYTITSEDGSNSTTWNIFVDFVVSNFEHGQAQLAIYPNPAGSELVVEHLNQQSRPLRLQLFDMQGHLIRSIGPFDGIVRIPIADVRPGLHLLKVIERSGLASTYKVIVDR